MLSYGLVEPLWVNILQGDFSLLLLFRLVFGLLNDLSLTLDVVKGVSGVYLALLILLLSLFCSLFFHVKHVIKVTGIIAREIHFRIDCQLLLVFLNTLFFCFRVIVDQLSCKNCEGIEISLIQFVNYAFNI
jgi:hypothetical protein